jgi:[ribosomal protein S5]-alanine N-acetyltransferase
MKRVEIRPQRVRDAKRFYEILTNPNFIYFASAPASIEEERKFLRQNAEKRRKNTEHNFAVLYGGKLVGAIGVKVDTGRRHIGEIGYFVDQDYWGKGIGTRAVKLAEQFAFKELKLKRLEILVETENRASSRVAVKNNYKKEGTLRKKVHNRKGFRDTYLYAKVK